VTAPDLFLSISISSFGLSQNKLSHGSGQDDSSGNLSNAHRRKKRKNFYTFSWPLTKRQLGPRGVINHRQSLESVRVCVCCVCVCRGNSLFVTLCLRSLANSSQFNIRFSDPCFLHFFFHFYFFFAFIMLQEFLSSLSLKSFVLICT